MDKILKKERVKECKNEWTNEWRNERTNEQTKKAISLMFLCEKTTKKTTKCKEKVWGKCAKTAISSIFLAFSAGKICFSKIGLGQILDIAILHQCAKFHKKYKVQLEKFKKYRFSGKNRLFRQFLESSGYKNQFNWQMNHA